MVLASNIRKAADLSLVLELSGIRLLLLPQAGANFGPTISTHLRSSVRQVLTSRILITLTQGSMDLATHGLSAGQLDNQTLGNSDVSDTCPKKINLRTRDSNLAITLEYGYMIPPQLLRSGPKIIIYSSKC